jgi:hypothetical protein
MLEWLTTALIQGETQLKCAGGSSRISTGGTAIGGLAWKRSQPDR